MELGNLVFGHRNLYETIDRDRFQDLFCNLLERHKMFDEYESIKTIVTDVFELRPYYWGECECGFDQKSVEWSKTHFHTERCYQVKLYEWEKSNGGHSIDKVPHELLKEFGLTEQGWGMHCTCQQDGEWIEFLHNNFHTKDCELIKPNFWYKPTNLVIEWYKYPLRDSYSNRPFNEMELKEIFKVCRESMK